MCIQICMYTYCDIHVYIYIYIYIQTYIYIYICAPLTPSLSLFLSLCVSLPLSLYIYVYMHISIYIYIYWRSHLTKQKYPRLFLEQVVCPALPCLVVHVLHVPGVPIVLGVLVVVRLQAGVLLCCGPPHECKCHVVPASSCRPAREERRGVVHCRRGFVSVCPRRCANTCSNSSRVFLGIVHIRGTARRRGRRSVPCHLLQSPLCKLFVASGFLRCLLQVCCVQVP